MKVKSMFRIIIGVVAVGTGIAVCAAEDPGKFFAGTSKVDITPDQTFITPHGECAFRLPDNPGKEKTPPKNILDPIYARVLVLKNGKTSLAIVSLDLVLFSSKKVITEAKEKWKVDHVILSSTHTHSSMVPRGLCPTPKGWEAWENITEEAGLLLDWPGFSEDPWYAETEAKIVAAIGEAMKNLFPAQIVAGKGPYDSVYMAHNRRMPGADGKVTMNTMMWGNPKRLPTKPIDPTLGVVQVNDNSGKPRAFLVHYACHPVIMMNFGVLSRDFPGAMCDYLEKEMGNECMPMFLQGALGDLDPCDTGATGEQAINLMRQGGISLAKSALRVAKSIKQQDRKNTSIEINEDMVRIPYRNGDKVTEALILTAVINNDLALVTMPGEIFVQHQLDINGKSPIPNTFLLGQAYCGAGSPWLRYIPSVQAVHEGGFGAGTNWYSFIAADAGEKMVDQAVVSIKKLIEDGK